MFKNNKNISIIGAISIQYARKNLQFCNFQPHTKKNVQLTKNQIKH